MNKEIFENIKWNNEVTRILPRGEELEEKWTFFWSDSTKEFVHGESPITIRKTIAGNEILSTSYNYVHTDHGKYQILIWKGVFSILELVYQICLMCVQNELIQI